MIVENDRADEHTLSSGVFMHANRGGDTAVFHFGSSSTFHLPNWGSKVTAFSSLFTRFSGFVRFN